MADTTISWVIEHIEKGGKLEISADSTPEEKAFVREQKKLVLKDGVLYRQVADDELGSRLQLVIPMSHRKEAMQGVHEDLFHTHLDDAIKHARMRFYWPHMFRDLEKKIKKCGRCLRRGAPAQKAQMQTITSTFPLELLSIDFLTIDANGQKQNVLVILDHFTKFAVAVCTKDQTARTIARTLWHEFFMIYGFPKRILTDQGRDFESKLMKNICDMAGIRKCRTTPYHPAGNPVERWNRTLLNMIRSLEEDEKINWRKNLPAVVHAYNSCIHSSTGYSPYFLFFGRHPRLPIDLAFGVDVGRRKNESSIQYIRSLKSQLKSAYERAAENMAKAADRNKARYDISAHTAELEVGDRCLVRRLGPRVTSKISDKWEAEVYVVVDRAEDVPVYTVQEETGNGPCRTLHRNFLLPVGVLDTETTSKELAEEKRRRQDKGERLEKRSTPCEADGEELSVTVVPTRLRPEAVPFVPEVVARELQEQGFDPEQDGPAPHLDQVETVASDEGSDGDDARINPEPPVELRRSTRLRRPVERLNLAHQVVTSANASILDTDDQIWESILSTLSLLKSDQCTL